MEPDVFHSWNFDLSILLLMLQKNLNEKLNHDPFAFQLNGRARTDA